MLIINLELSFYLSNNGTENTKHCVAAIHRGDIIMINGCVLTLCLQRFDAVVCGWAAGRASGL